MSRVYIGAEKVETLFQQGLLPGSEGYEDASSWAQDFLGVSEEEFNESMQSGFEMELAAAKLFDAVAVLNAQGTRSAARKSDDFAEGEDGAPSESAEESKTSAIYDALSRYIRFARDKMTPAEAEESDRSIKEMRRRDFFNIASDLEAAREEEASAARVLAASRMQLEEQGIDAETAAADSFVRSRAYLRLARFYNEALSEEARGNKRWLAEDIERMFPLVVVRDGEGKMSGLRFDTAAGAWPFYQPVNPGVDLKATVRGVVVHPALSAAEASRVKTNRFKKEFARKLAGNYRNEDTGWDIRLSVDNVSHAVYSALSNKVVDFETSIKILEGLPNIIQNAKLIETHSDRHEDSYVSQIHRMFTSVKLAGDDNTIYTVKLTVKEMQAQYEVTIDGIYRAYDTKVEKEAPDVKRELLAPTEPLTRNTSGAYEISIADMLKSVNDNAGVPYVQGDAGTFYQRAWHGSPFRFDRFSTKKVNTGAGAQLYGWGLYFAGKREVGEWYRQHLSDGEDGQLYGVEIPDDGDYLLWDKRISPEQARRISAVMQERGVEFPHELWFDGENITDYGKAESRIEEMYGEEKSVPLYYVGVGIKEGRSLDEAIDYAKSELLKSSEDFAAEGADVRDIIAWLDENRDKFVLFPFDGWGAAGSEFYAKLSEALRDDPKAASLLLKEAGIPGIKYRESGSRSADEGSYNYVVFDDNDVSIAETFYQPVNDGVNPDARVRVVDLSGAYDGKNDVRVQELKAQIREMAPLRITSADNAAVIEILNKNAAHLAHSGAPMNYALNVPAVRKAAFSNLSDVVASSVLIETVKNEKIKEIDPSWSKSKKKSAQRKNKIALYHRFYVPVSTDGQTYKVIRLVAEEDKNGDINVDPKTVALYDVIPESKNAPLPMSPENRAPDQQGGARLSALPTSGSTDVPGLSTISIREMLSGVKDFSGEDYFQPSRGSISFPMYEGAPVTVRLGKDADRSTFVHEFAHLYFWHLRNLASLDTVLNSETWEGSPAAWNRDLDTVAKWWNERAEDIAEQAKQFVSPDARGGLSAEGFRAWLASGMEKESAEGRRQTHAALAAREGSLLTSPDGEERAASRAYDRAAQEYFARGFERYLAEGRAPVESKELLSVFRRFKKWLCEIYRTLAELNVELSDDVRAVFDRVVASDEAIERARTERAVDNAASAARRAAEVEDRDVDEANSAFAPEGDEEPELDFGGDEDAYDAAKEDLLGVLMSDLSPERLQEMRERADEIRPQVLKAVLAEPGFRALSMMEEISHCGQLHSTINLQNFTQSYCSSSCGSVIGII